MTVYRGAFHPHDGPSRKKLGSPESFNFEISSLDSTRRLRLPSDHVRANLVLSLPKTPYSLRHNDLCVSAFPARSGTIPNPEEPKQRCGNGHRKRCRFLAPGVSASSGGDRRREPRPPTAACRVAKIKRENGARDRGPPLRQLLQRPPPGKDSARGAHGPPRNERQAERRLKCGWSATPVTPPEPALSHRKPASFGVQRGSPRSSTEVSPSAMMSKGFLIVGSKLTPSS